MKNKHFLTTFWGVAISLFVITGCANNRSTQVNLKDIQQKNMHRNIVYINLQTGSTVKAEMTKKVNEAFASSLNKEAANTGAN
jgi:hypothetical protein